MKRLFWIALLIFVLGVIATITFGLIAREQLRSFASGKDEYDKITKNYSPEEIAGLTNISVDIFNRALYVLPSETDEIIVQYYNTPYGKITEKLEDSRLSFDESIVVKIFHFGLDWLKSLMYPDYNRFYLYLPENLTVNLKLNTTNGRLEIKNINLTELKGATSNGRIVLEDLNATKIDVASSNGAIIASRVEALESIKLKTSNGRISVDGMETPYLFCDTSNGRINVEIEGNKDEYYINMTTTNGSYYVNGEKSRNAEINDEDLAKKIILDTSNGDISIFFSTK